MSRRRTALALGLASSLVSVLASPLPVAAQPAKPPGSAREQPVPPREPPPPPSQSMSLGQVLEHAVRHSPTLAAARIDIDIAEASVLEATGIEDWLITATGSYFRKRSEAPAGSIIGTDATDTASGSLAVGKLLPTGGNLSVKAQADHSKSLFAFGGGMESIENSTSVIATLNQPLLRNFGPTTTYANETRAEVARDAARLQRDAAARTMMRDLVAAYWELAYAFADLEIRRSSVTLARERRRLTDAAARGGATAPTEVLAVDQVIAGREEEVVAAEQTVLQRSLELRRLAGLEITPSDLELGVTAPLEVEPKPPELQDVVKAAFETSPEIAALEAQGRGARLEVEVSENGL